MAAEADLPVETPVIGRLHGFWEQLGIEDILELFKASQCFCPRGAVDFGDDCCIELFVRSFFQGL